MSQSEDRVYTLVPMNQIVAGIKVITIAKQEHITSVKVRG